MNLEEFSNKLYESKILHDYKDGKIDYRKVHDWIVSQEQAITVTPCCTQLKVKKQKLNFGDWKYSRGLRYVSDHTYKNTKGELFDAEDVNKMYDNYYNL